MVVLETPVTRRGDLLFQRSDVFSSAALANRPRQTSSRAKLHTRIPFKSSVPMHRAGDTHAAPVCSNCWRPSCRLYCEFLDVLLASEVVVWCADGCWLAVLARAGSLPDPQTQQPAPLLKGIMI